MFDPKAAVAIAAVLAGAGVCCTALIVWSKWLFRPRTVETPTNVDQDVRLRRLEQAIESIANEVERLGENQQFTTRLLMDRPATELPIDRAARENAPLIVPPTPYRPLTTPH